ncbi:AAA family ATPase [Ancylobacter sp. G4_0304]|uniref:bifunctional aminoglycoside phosphotransferase/ATP-binding protein n=1 Tax=Ancylobacter sp. G4_0304 TaxID=3114289 RepID=UPI0039C651AC
MTDATHVVADQSAVFDLLAAPPTHGIAGDVRRIDTHGAVVFLAGEDVYKVKRAVRFDFMDLSTLEKRRAACAREIAVNAANAPDIYLGLVAVTREGAGLALGGAGEPVEWAVHMRRFDEEMTFDRLAARGELTRERLSRLAAAIAASHARAPRHEEVASAAELARVVADNQAGLAERPELFAPDAVAELGAVCRQALERLGPLLEARARAGEVRRCHGDLHLRNIVEVGERVVLFDALEFSERLATTDRVYDLAFLLMDLAERGLIAEANLVFNRYLAQCREGEPLGGLPALPLFLALRAAIRAQVTAAGADHLDGARRAAAHKEARDYLAFAHVALQPAPAELVAVGGLSGTGKSTLAAALAPGIGPLPGAVHLRSDVERKRLMGAPEFETLPEAGYAHAITAQVYERLREQARAVLAAGHGVIVDAVHQRPEERAALEQVARVCGARFRGLWLEAPLDALAARVSARRGDASDAGEEVVRQQAARAIGPLDWVRVDAGGRPDEVLARARAALDASGD